MPLTEDRRRQLDDIVMRMEANKEPEDAIQWVVNDFKQKYGDYQDTTMHANQNAEDSQEQPGGNFFQRIGIGGTPEQRTPFGLPRGAAEAVFPRASALPPEEIAKPTGRSVAAGVKDLLSIPGRAVGAIPAVGGAAIRALGGRIGTNIGGGESPKDAFQRTEGNNIAGEIVRDPMLPLSVGAGLGATKAIGVGKSAIQKLGLGAAAGGLEGLAVGGVKQGLDMAEGEGFDAKELGAEVAGSAIFGGLSEGASSLLRQGLAPKMFRSSLMPNKAVRVKGFDPDNIVKYDVGGSFSDISKKSGAKIQAAKEAADNYLETFAQKNQSAKINVDDVIQKFMEDMDSGNLDTYFAADQLDAAEKSVDKILEAFSKRGYSGDIDVSTANKAKRWLGRGVFKKGASPTIEESASAKVKELLDLRLRDKIQEIAPEIADYNKVMRDLIPIRQAAEDAAERYGNRNVFTGMTNMQIGQAGALGAVMTGNPGYIAGTLGLAGANSYLAPGRGAQLVNRVGQAVESVGRTGGRSYIGGNIGTRIVNLQEEEEKRKAQERMSQQFR